MFLPPSSCYYASSSHTLPLPPTQPHPSKPLAPSARSIHKRPSPPLPPVVSCPFLSKTNLFSPLIEIDAKKNRTPQHLNAQRRETEKYMYACVCSCRACACKCAACAHTTSPWHHKTQHDVPTQPLPGTYIELLCCVCCELLSPTYPTCKKIGAPSLPPVFTYPHSDVFNGIGPHQKIHSSTRTNHR